MSAPERIYLQWIEDESAPYIHEGVTWCADRIEDDDVEYTRADEIETLRKDALRYLRLRAYLVADDESWDDRIIEACDISEGSLDAVIDAMTQGGGA